MREHLIGGDWIAGVQMSKLFDGTRPDEKKWHILIDGGFFGRTSVRFDSAWEAFQTYEQIRDDIKTASGMAALLSGYDPQMLTSPEFKEWESSHLVQPLRHFRNPTIGYWLGVPRLEDLAIFKLSHWFDPAWIVLALPPYGALA